MKKILILLLLSFSLHADKTISIQTADCKENKSKKILEQRLGFQPRSIYRGQISVGELIKIYSAKECPKIKKTSYSCVVGEPLKQMTKEDWVTYKMYSGECL